MKVLKYLIDTFKIGIKIGGITTTIIMKLEDKYLRQGSSKLLEYSC